MTTVAERRAISPPPLLVALPLKLSARVRELAEARGDLPSVFVTAAIARIVSDDLVEAVFDGERAADASPGQGRQTFEAFPAGLTMLQAGVVYVLGFHADADGVCRLPPSAFAAIIGRGSQNHITTILPLLAERGLAESVREKARVLRWKLTWRGQSVFRELAGEKGE